MSYFYFTTLDHPSISNTSNIFVKYCPPHTPPVKVQLEIKDSRRKYFSVLTHPLRLVYKEYDPTQQKYFDPVKKNFRCSTMVLSALSSSDYSFSNKKSSYLLERQPLIAHNLTVTQELKNNYTLAVGGESIDDPTCRKRFRVTPDRIKRGIYLLTHNHPPSSFTGLYSSPSDPSTKMIVNGKHPGLIEGRVGHTMSEFDGRSCLVYFPHRKTYFLYVRSNPCEGVRSVQVATATGLNKSWSVFKNIDIPDLPPTHNIYYYSVQVCPWQQEVLMAVFPYSDKKDAWIGINFSHDGVHWSPIQRWIPSMTSPTDRARCVDMNAQNIISTHNSNEWLLYVHRNYTGDSRQPENLIYYRFQSTSLTSLHPVDRESVASFTLHVDIKNLSTFQIFFSLFPSQSLSPSLTVTINDSNPIKINLDRSPATLTREQITGATKIQFKFNGLSINYLSK